MLLNVSGCIKDSDICHSIKSKTIGGQEDRKNLKLVSSRIDDEKHPPK